MGRAWQAPPGNFMGSARIVPAPGEAPIHLLSFVAALALFDVCATLAPPERLTLKWPNDLLLDGGKLSGILLEAEAGEVVLGIGVNLAHAPDVPGRRTMSLVQAMGDAPAPVAFGEKLAEALARRRQQWRDDGFATIRQQWLARAHPLGEPLTVTRNGVVQQGCFGGLADDGAMLFDTTEGRQPIHAAEVFALSERKAEEGPDAARD